MLVAVFYWQYGKQNAGFSQCKQLRKSGHAGVYKAE